MPDEIKKIVPPTVHRMEGELRVCDPEKTDHTHTIEGWRVVKMMGELAEGFEFLKKYKLAASIFGSARLTPDSPYYKQAEELAAKLSHSGFVIVTGGAAGIMEAGNKGAFEAGGQSIGINIKLPKEQGGNKYTTAEMTFNYFFTRRVMLSFASEVYVFFPGGFGTLDEFFEIVTLIQTNKIKRIPVVLYGAAFWNPLIDFMKKTLLSENMTINKDDLELFVVCDSVEEAHTHILDLVKC